MVDIAAIACNSVIANATAGTPAQGTGGVVLGHDWLVLSVLALVVSTLALSILYMVASFLRNTPLITWTKFELFQVFGTAVILVFFSSTILGICTFDMSWMDPLDAQHPQGRYIPVAQGQATNMYNIIDNYFSKLQEVGYLLFGYIMYISKILTYMSRLTVLSSPLGVGSNENPLETMGQLNSLIFVMMSGFTTSFILLQLQMRMLEYIALACIGFLFPFGIFLRCFEPTRSFGGTLLGMSISFFLFYPILMVFNDFVMYSQISVLAAEQEANILAANGKVQTEATGQKGAGTMTGGLWGDFGSFSSLLADGMLIFVKPIMVYFVGAVVLPIINFIVLVEITRGATSFMGDELDVSNLTRLI